MGLPFSEASEAELIARVAYQLVVCTYHKRRGAQARPGQLIAETQALPFVRQSLEFRIALSSMYLHCVTNGRKSREWRTEVCRRARSRLTFRAVFAWDYKAGRRDPRVTNRGVTASPPATRAELEAFDLAMRRDDEDGR